MYKQNYHGVVVLPMFALVAQHLRDGMSGGELVDVGRPGRAGGRLEKGYL